MKSHLMYRWNMCYKTDLQSVHGGENEYEPICYRHSDTDTAGKEQDDTASSDDSQERRELEKAADMLLGRSAYCEKNSRDRYSDKR